MIVNIKTLELNETNYNELINLYNYFGFNAIGKRKRSTLKEKITKHCLTCLIFLFLN